MAKRDPHDVLGIEPGASPTQIKAAWRKLARSHHPDLTGDDPEASRIATRQMAEINEAYAALTREGYGRRSRAAGEPGGAAWGGSGAAAGTNGTSRRGGPPRPRPGRPVTGRLDTTETFRPRNQTLRADGTRPAAASRTRPPLRAAGDQREPPRASTPTGPLNRSRLRNFRPPPGPPLAEALDRELEFGKFHGHTLGQVAAFEPSYIDWLANTITRDRDLKAAARVVREDLDRRGVVRRPRPAPSPQPARSGHSA